MAGRSLSQLLLVVVVCQLTKVSLSEVRLTPTAFMRSPQVWSSELRPVKSGTGDQGDVRDSQEPLTPSDLLRSPQVRFSVPVAPLESERPENEMGTGGGGAEPPSPEAARYDIGPALTPRDFSTGMEQMQTVASVPLVAGRIDPIELADEFEGDIVLTDADVAAVTDGAVPGRRIWPGGVIRYVIASGFSAAERGVIAAAIRELERRTCVGVQPVPPGGPSGDYVHIVRGRGCSSAVGRLGGNQTLSLSEGCFTRGVVLHQLLHAAGFWHEQSRPDRYQYVRVLSENVAKGRLFELRSYARVPLPPTPGYQRRSLMHLSRWAFAADRSKPTLQSTDEPSEPLGQRDGLTPEDALAVNLLYGCNEGAPPPLPTPPTVDRDCADKNEHCDWWARRGECSRNPGYMYDSCAKACHQCIGPGCEDLDSSCTMWAVLDQCGQTSSYMHVYCRRACQLCPRGQSEQPEVCRDKRQDNCQYWSRTGECRRNPTYMMEYCRKACGFCRSL